MMRSLLTKTLYDKRWFTLGWAMAFGFMSFVMVIFYPSFTSVFQIDKLSTQLPPALQGLIGSPESMTTLHGYIAEQLFNIRIPLFIMIMSIVLGLGLSISDEESGRMRTILMAPISRTKVVLSKFTAGLFIMGAISLVTVLALYIGIFVIHESPPNILIFQLFALSWLFGTTTIVLVTGLGLAIGQRAATTGISLLLTIGSFILSTFGSTVAWLKPYEIVSLLHYYDSNGLSSKTFKLTNVAILLTIGLAIVFVAVIRFRRRDIQ